MAMIGLRYDLRAPSWGSATHAEMYAACLDQARWADERGIDFVVLSEHHGADDGYMPAPRDDGGGDRRAHPAHPDQHRRHPRAAARPGAAGRAARRARPRQRGTGQLRRRRRLPVRGVRDGGRRPQAARQAARGVRRRHAQGVDGRAVRVAGPHGARDAEADDAAAPDDDDRRLDRGRGAARGAAAAPDVPGHRRPEAGRDLRRRVRQGRVRPGVRQPPRRSRASCTSPRTRRRRGRRSARTRCTRPTCTRAGRRRGSARPSTCTRRTSTRCARAACTAS